MNPSLTSASTVAGEIVGSPMIPVRVAGWAISSIVPPGGPSGVSSPPPSWWGIIGMKNGVLGNRAQFIFIFYWRDKSGLFIVIGVTRYLEQNEPFPCCGGSRGSSSSC